MSFPSISKKSLVPLCREFDNKSTSEFCFCVFLRFSSYSTWNNTLAPLALIDWSQLVPISNTRQIYSYNKRGFLKNEGEEKEEEGTGYERISSSFSKKGFSHLFLWLNG